MDPSAGALALPGLPADLRVGLRAQVELIVTEADTAPALGSGDVAVLATPRVVALAEAATVAATTPLLAGGPLTTVGTRVELDHLAATAVGATVRAQAQLVAVTGRRLQFEITVCEGQAVVAQGRVDRVLVDRERFLTKATERAKADGLAQATDVAGPTSTLGSGP